MSDQAITIKSGMSMQPRRRDNLVARPLDGETLVLDRDTGRIHQLNGTATLVWDLCDGTRTIEEIAGQLTAQFELDEQTAFRDVLALVKQLQDLGLVDSGALAGGGAHEASADQGA
jgi:pyrroloquinoline quinone biosynthesis protein D